MVDGSCLMHLNFTMDYNFTLASFLYSKIDIFEFDAMPNETYHLTINTNANILGSILNGQSKGNMNEFKGHCQVIFFLVVCCCLFASDPSSSSSSLFVITAHYGTVFNLKTVV